MTVNIQVELRWNKETGEISGFKPSEKGNYRVYADLKSLTASIKGEERDFTAMALEKTPKVIITFTNSDDALHFQALAVEWRDGDLENVSPTFLVTFHLHRMPNIKEDGSLFITNPRDNTISAAAPTFEAVIVEQTFDDIEAMLGSQPNALTKAMDAHKEVSTPKVEIRKPVLKFW